MCQRLKIAWRGRSEALSVRKAELFPQRDHRRKKGQVALTVGVVRHPVVPEADGARAHRELDRLAAVAAGADGVQVLGRELVRPGDRADEAPSAHVVRLLAEVAVHSLVRVRHQVRATPFRPHILEVGDGARVVALDVGPRSVGIVRERRRRRVAVLLRAGRDTRGIVGDAARRAALFAVQPPAWGVVKDR